MDCAKLLYGSSVANKRVQYECLNMAELKEYGAVLLNK